MRIHDIKNALINHTPESQRPLYATICRLNANAMIDQTNHRVLAVGSKFVHLLSPNGRITVKPENVVGVWRIAARVAATAVAG